MIRVLQHFGSLNRGGLETFVMNVYRTIDRNKVQFDFLVNAKGDYAEEIEALGGHIFLTPARNSGLRKYDRGLRDFFYEHQGEYAAIHFHASSLTSLSPLKYAKKYGIPIRIIHSHSSSISHSLSTYYYHLLMHYKNKCRVSHFATHFFGCSKIALDWMYNGTGCRDKAVMINNAIDTDLFKYDINKRKETRQLLSIDTSTILLGHVGRFIALKNHSFLIDVFNEYHQVNPNSKLLLVGGGDLLPMIVKKAKELGIENDVIFAGIREDIPYLLQAMDIFVMPSLFEGLPVTLVEAQASGLPILASDTISKDTNLTPLFHTFSLDKTANEWAMEITNILNSRNREDTSALIEKAGFDIKTTTSYLFNIYNKIR